ncbi:hypothetical protein VPH35_132400 [Triticum aestivum]
MMRNNRMFQSLGIGAIALMIRKTNDVQEGRSDEAQEGSGVINDDHEYNPKEDEVIDGEEVYDVVVQKTVKVQNLSCLEGWGSCMLCASLCSHIYVQEEELRNICCNASRKGDGPTSRTNREDPGT